MFPILFLISTVLGVPPSAAQAADEFVKPVVDAKPAETKQKKYSAILVDKAANSVEVTDLQGGEYIVTKKYHVTLGKVKGDKLQEGDLKTPEGIYTFKALLKPPGLAKKFGKMAFYVNYPNDFDRIAGRSGYGIMFHATDTPNRLNENFDSEGCVVCSDDELAEIAPSIRLGLTPILIFDKITDEYRKPGKDPSIRSFFETWIKSWEARDIDAYINHYHADFEAQGKDFDAWKEYKSQLNKRYVDISIGPEDVLYYKHPKYWMITFTQNYRSKVKGGGWGHRSRGTKIITIAEEAGKPKIVAETYTQLMW